jgi:hypothetical protein
MSGPHKLARRMPARRTARRALIALTGLLAAIALGACGKKHDPEEPVREGLSAPLGGLRYTVFLTRQLNLKNPEDSGYVPGLKEAAPGHGLFGVFAQACNTGDEPADAVPSDRFKIVDAQGEEYPAKGLGADNPFAWHGGPVVPENCQPPRGSLAQQGPTSGSLVLFDLPLAATENRPLMLHIQGPFDAEAGKPEEIEVILDI